jgi:hypothetical protein
MDASSHPALLLVDGVSSIGALDFQVGAGAALGWRGGWCLLGWAELGWPGVSLCCCWGRPAAGGLLW